MHCLSEYFLVVMKLFLDFLLHSLEVLLQESQAELQDTEAVYQEAMFIVSAQTQQTRVQRLSPENKGVSPYVPLQAGYRSKKQSSTHLWLHVISLAISFPQCYMTFMFQFFKFYLSLCHPFSLSRQNTACLFLF
jgi:hypothetical protein